MQSGEAGRERKRKEKKLSIILSLLLSFPSSIALPSPSHTSVFAQSKCIRQAGVTSVGVGCLSWVLLHISMTWPPLSPRGGDVHINSSHTRERRGTRVEHRWAAGQEEKRRDRRMGRENATAFHPHCVIYNISDTTTPKFALRASREKNAIPHRRVKRKKTITVKIFPSPHGLLLGLYVTCKCLVNFCLVVRCDIFLNIHQIWSVHFSLWVWFFTAGFKELD